jgi:hypothetical protein
MRKRSGKRLGILSAMFLSLCLVASVTAAQADPTAIDDTEEGDVEAEQGDPAAAIYEPSEQGNAVDEPSTSEGVTPSQAGDGTAANASDENGNATANASGEPPHTSGGKSRTIIFFGLVAILFLMVSAIAGSNDKKSKSPPAQS